MLTIWCTTVVLLLVSTEEWRLPPCPGIYNKNTWTNCVGTVVSSKGNKKYVGEWKDDKADGQGTSTFANGNKYVGEYKVC